jgi:tetratricopeptide (TPR) repeat protein
MKLLVRALPLLLFCLSNGAGFAQTIRQAQSDNGGDPLLQKFLSDFNLPAASESAEMRLRVAPKDALALFVRMETAELQERPEVVLDSALRLCGLGTPPELQALASSRVLQHAGNTWAFNSALRRVKSSATVWNGCTFNLRLALVAAAADGAKVDLDRAAHSSGLLTHWRIVGPFGKYNNVDFERRWPPESDSSFRPQYPVESNPGPKSDDRRVINSIRKAPSGMVAPERFWLRDGMIALPEYFPSSGIFFAAGDVEVTNGARWQIDLLSSGAYEIFIDGKSALLHDSRFAAGASRVSSALRLRAGHHRILVKFSPDAAPLSVAIHPQFQRSIKARSPLPQPLQEYAQKMIAYFRGDFTEMERLAGTNAAHGGDVVHYYLRALLYSAAEDHSSRADAAWKAVATAQPSAFLARLKSAEGAMERGQNETARADVMSVLAERPQSETALQLAFSLSHRNQAEAPALLSRLLELHSSCARLAEAVRFYNSTAEQDKARHIELQLASCAPESLVYARLLSESGRHSAAAAYLQQVVTRNPFHRAARRFLVEQLLLDNQTSAAKLQARQLKDMAHNAKDYVRLVEDPAAAQDSRSQRAAGFVHGTEFYVPYRRDGIDLVRRSAQRSFSGGAAVILLSDRVVMVQREGPVSVYVHRITRPLSKEGISRYGEISFPRGADLLELRTIKTSGEIIEPELAQQKPTVSMPALEPGDAIEEEYVTHYAEPGQAPEKELAHTFGSFAAPILYSRMVLLSPPDARIHLREQASPPQPLVGENNGVVIRIWERDNIGQTIAESFLPDLNLLPTVALDGADKSRDRLRNDLIEATRTGLHVLEAATELQLAQITGDAEKARLLYRFVTSKVDSTGPDWTGSVAEDTLANGQGSRTMALLALARSIGLKTSLLLAHKVDQSCGNEHSLSCYTEPLVRFWLASSEPLDADAEADELPFGAIPPSLDRRDALLVPLLAEEMKKPEIVSLSTRMANEKSVAEGNLSLNEVDLLADVHVQLGSARAQEIRRMLRSAGERERQLFFEQLAMRIFPGATAVTGTASHEYDPDQPLQLSFHCTVPQFITLQSSTVEIDQLAPALGLAPLYAKSLTRKFPLYIESLFFESAVFHLHLPLGMNVRILPADFTERSEFGEYALHFARSPHQVDVRRDFHIPVQVVAPERYAAFAKFATQIDQAERQRISLEITKKDAASTQPRSSVQR